MDQGVLGMMASIDVRVEVVDQWIDREMEDVED